MMNNIRKNPAINLALWNLRSTENVAAILRTADAFAVQTVYFIGDTPHPSLDNDRRLPHVCMKMDRVFAKIALGAEKFLKLAYYEDLDQLLAILEPEVQIVALEQASDSHVLPALPTLKDNVMLIVGEERHGLPQMVLDRTDAIMEIPMLGRKESLNVSVAAGIALYALLIR